MIQNSLSGVLDQIVKITANNMNMYSAIHEAVFSNQPSVKTQIYLASGEARDIELPSLGYMKSRVDRIDSTLETLMGATGDSIVRMSDGSYRKMYINRLDIPRSTEVVKGDFVYSKSDSIINMMEKDVTVDIPVTLYNKEDRVELNIIAYHGKENIPNTETLNKPFSQLKQLFDQWKENDTIEEYSYFKVIKDIEPADMSAYGGVYVLRVVDTESIDADENVEHKKIYYISDIAFRGKEGSVYPISQGDILTLYNSQGYHDTRVKVEIIDKTRSYIKVSYVDGYQPITVGSQLFPYIDGDRKTGVIKFSLSNRYQYWIYPTLITKTGYRHEEGEQIHINATTPDSICSGILDLGKYLDKYRKDTYFTRDDWNDANIVEDIIAPDSTNTDNVSFTIVDVSRDISSSSYTKITQLESQKKSVENTIEAYRDRINVLRNIISSGTSAGSAAQNELARVTQSLEDAQNEFNTLVFNISDELSTNALESKYEIHGIVKLAALDIPFECIGVELRYRFIGNDSDIQKKEYYDLNGTKVPFNSWRYTPFYCRSRQLDDTTRKFRWNPNTIEQTSFVIPIETRYNTIIQFRYVFEAGYPENPKKSTWSDDIYVPWDSTLERSSTKALQNINQADQVKASVNNTLATNGMFRHTAKSFTAGEKYFGHSAEEIASGWVTEEQQPISLYEKLKDIATVAQQLNDAFNAVDINNFKFTLIASDGTETEISEGTNNIVTTPAYMELLKSQNGKTVSKSDESDVDYVATMRYTLRISAKSKYVRFTKISKAPNGYSLYNFSDFTDGNYPENTTLDPSMMFNNRYLKVGLLRHHGTMDTEISESNNSRYRKQSSSLENFATVMASDANGISFNEGSTLAFSDDAYIDVPITVVIAPVSISGSTASPELMSLTKTVESPVEVYANVGSYINSLDLTIGITFVTSMK